MKVMILGSLGSKLPANVRTKIQEACLAIGDSLAKNGVSLIVGADVEHTADRWVVDGAAASSKSIDVYIYRPSNKIRENGEEKVHVTFEELKNNPKYKKLRFHHMWSEGAWSSTHVAGIQYSDAVLVISGADGAETGGHIAQVLGKPMLPLASFPGASQKLWERYSSAYRMVGFSNDEKSLFSTWGPNSASHIVPAFNKLARNNPYRPPRDRSIYLLAALTIFAAMTWTALYFGGLFYVAPRPAIIVVLGMCSAVFGVILRNTVRHMAEDYEPKNGRVFAAELISGVILTFAFYMFFSLGSVVVAAKVPNFEDQQDFQRVALCVSLLGVAASFLMERAIPEISRRLSGVLGGQDPHFRKSG